MRATSLLTYLTLIRPDIQRNINGSMYCYLFVSCSDIINVFAVPVEMWISMNTF